MSVTRRASVLNEPFRDDRWHRVRGQAERARWSRAAHTLSPPLQRPIICLSLERLFHEPEGESAHNYCRMTAATAAVIRTPGLRPALVYVDAMPGAGQVAFGLRDRFRVSFVESGAMGIKEIARRRPAFVVCDLSLPDGDGLAVCHAAKKLELPATVLVTTRWPELVPAALLAGCDGVLMKPFALSLLSGRMGRLIRSRRTDGERPPFPVDGTNQKWPLSSCPRCHLPGVTSFEFVSHRRAWFACIECQQVWIAPRLEKRAGLA